MTKVRLRRILKGRKGSASIFIMLLAMSLSLMTLSFIKYSKEVATGSMAKSMGNLWSQSILSHYDKSLLEEYGIFAFFGDGREIKNELGFYMGEAFKGKKAVEAKIEDISLKDYSLINIDNIKKQIISQGKFDAGEGLAENLLPSKWSKNTKDEKKSKAPDVINDKKDNATISNDKVISLLPSSNMSGRTAIKEVYDKLKSVNSLKDVVKKGSEGYLINKYIEKRFGNNVNPKDYGYFRNEWEYIIAGKPSDEDNRKYVRNIIIATREPFNMAYLYKDKGKDAALTLAAQLLTPGPAAILTKEALRVTWAFAESVNDYNALISGDKIALVKDDNTWATDIGSILSNKEKEYIKVETENGNTYEDYLKALLYLKGADAKIINIMDLIQINMQYRKYENFRIMDYYVGLDFTASVNGKSYNFSKEY